MKFGVFLCRTDASRDFHVDPTGGPCGRYLLGIYLKKKRKQIIFAYLAHQLTCTLISCLNVSLFVQIPKQQGAYQSVQTNASVGQMASFQSVGETKKMGGYSAAVPKKTKPKSNENSAMLMKAMLLGQWLELITFSKYPDKIAQLLILDTNAQGNTLLNFFLLSK